MKLDVFLDLDDFDKKVKTMTKEEKWKVWNQMKYLSTEARRLYQDKKISKITCNRIRKVWTFSPFQNVSFISSKKFHELMGVKNPNLKFIKTAIKKMMIIKKQEKGEKENETH